MLCGHELVPFISSRAAGKLLYRLTLIDNSRDWIEQVRALLKQGRLYPVINPYIEPGVI